MVKKRPCSIWQCRRPGDNVGHFLCAKALQQTHILPAKLMPPPLSHSLSHSSTRTTKTKKKGFPGEEMASARDTATSVT